MDSLEHIISAQIVKYLKLVILGLVQSTENAKMGSLNYRTSQNDLGTQTEPFKLIWLTHWDHGK